MLSPVWISGRGSRNRSMCLCHIFSLATQLKLKPCFLPVQRSSKACPAFFSLSSSYAYFMDPGMMIYVTLARCSIVHAVVILCCELAICGCWWPTSQARRYIYIYIQNYSVTGHTNRKGKGLLLLSPGHHRSSYRRQQAEQHYRPCLNVRFESSGPSRQCLSWC